jgi:hypothetical protein
MIIWRDKFIDDLHRAYKLASVQLAGLGAALSAAWLACPESLRNLLPQHLQTYFAIGTFVLIVFARVIKQPAPPLEAPSSQAGACDPPFPHTIPMRNQ